MSDLYTQCKVAKAQNKMLFIHGFADWCPHCKTMAETVYTDSALGVFYNSYFICIKLDMEKEGRQVGLRYKISKYPGLLFLDGNGEVVHRTTGEQKLPAMMQLGKDAINPEKQYRTFERLLVLITVMMGIFLFRKQQEALQVQVNFLLITLTAMEPFLC